MTKASRKQLILESGLLLEKYCDPCKVRPVIEKEHTATEARNYCLSVCKYGKQLADIGTRLQLPTDTSGTVELNKQNLHACIAQGLSWPQMENVFNYTKQYLQRKGKEWGLETPRTRKRPANALKRYLEMRRKGLSYERIAAELEISYVTLAAWRKRWGVD